MLEVASAEGARGRQAALCFLYLIGGELAAREGNCLLIRIIILGLKKRAAGSAADFRGVPTFQAACLDYAFNIKDTERLIELASAPLKGKKEELAGRIGLPGCFVCIYGTVPIEMESAEGSSF